MTWKQAKTLAQLKESQLEVSVCEKGDTKRKDVHCQNAGWYRPRIPCLTILPHLLAEGRDTEEIARKRELDSADDGVGLRVGRGR